VAVLVIAAICACFSGLLIPRGSGGRPDPRPRSIGPEQSQPAGNTSGESTSQSVRTISTRRYQTNSGANVVSTEATGQQTTGVVAAKFLSETPVKCLCRRNCASVGRYSTKCQQGSNNCFVSSNDLAARKRNIRGIRRVNEHHKHLPY